MLGRSTGYVPGAVGTAFPRPDAGRLAGSGRGDEEQLATRWRRDGIPAVYAHCGTGGEAPDQILVPWSRWHTPADWQLAFAHALTRTMSAAMDVAGGRRDTLTGERLPARPWDRALSWFISS